MKTIGGALATHIAQPATTLAHLWRIVRRDAVTFRFTDHQNDLVFGGNTYLAAGGIVHGTELVSSDGTGVDNMEVLALLAAAGIAIQDVLAGKFDFADVYISLVNTADLTQGEVKLIRGKTGELTSYLSTARTELRSLTQLLKQRVGRAHVFDCPYNLGDAHCTVNLATWTVTGTLTGVTNQRTLIDTGRTEANGHFEGGLLTLTSGAASDLKMEVKTWTLATKTFVLVMDIPLALAAGNSYSVYKGCDKSWGGTRGCKSFSNAHFGGFTHIPGNGFLRSYPDPK